MPPTKQPRIEPIPGYRLIELLGCGGFGEVWKCEAPGGLFKAIKFVYQAGHGPDADHSNARQELAAVQRIKDIRHPFLLSMDRVECSGGELVIVMELADRSLQDVFQAHQAEGRSGIPRAELLKYLRETAEVLDLMNLEYGLQHLDVKPRNLFMVRDHVKVGDFGLVQGMADREPGEPFAAITPLYAAPELFQGKISQRCDQYSLAIVYTELLTGRLPFTGNNVRQLMLQHTMQPPVLEPLPLSDRPLVARALAKDPAQRYACCADFVEALAEVERRHGPTRRRSLSMGSSMADTRSALSGGTVPLGPTPARALPDYQFLTCLNRSPLSESWEAVSAEGSRCQVKFLYGLGGHGRRQEQEAVARLQSLRHPALLTAQTVSATPGCLILVTGLIETNLRWRFQEAQAGGERGVPRDELLEYLGAVAQALDELAAHHQLQHLDLTPRALLIDEHKRSRIADFGLTQLLWLPSGQPLSQLQCRYAAPELIQRRLSPRCDQYSLALIYQEMLTGTHPFRGRTATAPSGAHPRTRSPQPQGPALETLPPGDRAAIARALDPDPERRFASCSELIEALWEVMGERGPPAGPVAETLPMERPTVHELVPAERPVVASQTGKEAIAELLHLARTWRPMLSEQGTTSRPDLGVHGNDCLAQDSFEAPLPAEGAIARFEGFRQQWNAQLVDSEDSRAVFRVATPSIRSHDGAPARPASLLLDVRWTAAAPELGAPVASPTLQARVTRGSTPSGLDEVLLRKVAEQLIESLRDQLVGQGDRRISDRVYWPHPVQMSFVGSDEGIADTVVCLGKDLSPTGIGLYLPTTVTSNQVRLQLRSPASAEAVYVDGTIVRVQKCAPRLFEIGVRFA